MVASVLVVVVVGFLVFLVVVVVVVILTSYVYLSHIEDRECWNTYTLYNLFGCVDSNPTSITTN